MLCRSWIQEIIITLPQDQNLIYQGNSLSRHNIAHPKNEQTSNYCNKCIHVMYNVAYVADET